MLLVLFIVFIALLIGGLVGLFAFISWKTSGIAYKGAIKATTFASKNLYITLLLASVTIIIIFGFLIIKSVIETWLI